MKVRSEPWNRTHRVLVEIGGEITVMSVAKAVALRDALTVTLAAIEAEVAAKNEGKP